MKLNSYFFYHFIFFNHLRMWMRWWCLMRNVMLAYCFVCMYFIRLRRNHLFILAMFNFFYWPGRSIFCDVINRNEKSYKFNHWFDNCMLLGSICMLSHASFLCLQNILQSLLHFLIFDKNLSVNIVNVCTYTQKNERKNHASI